MSIYDHRVKVIGDTTVSMIRSDTPLHAHKNSTGEIMFSRDGVWEDLWTGHAALAGDLFKWVCDNLSTGASIDEIDAYLMDRPDLF